jgi:sulfite exporter TauE/SafE
MLSSIHPLGERARQNRWILTVTSFTLGAGITGALVGGILGGAGEALGLGSISTRARSLILAASLIAAAAADLIGAKAPGPHRQVNERWINAFRGWVYAGSFGSQLALGTATYVVTWGLYAIYLAALLSATPETGAMIGVSFGLGRSISLWTAGWIDRPSRLARYHQVMRGLAPFTRTAIASVYGLTGLATLALEVT